MKSTYIITFTKDLNPVWTVSCMHHKFISCSLCTVPYQDKPSCCTCSLPYHYACKFWCWNVYTILCRYSTQCLKITRLLNVIILSQIKLTKHTIQDAKIVFWATILSVFIIISVVLVLSEKHEKQVLWMHQSYFKVLLQNCVELFQCSPLPLQTVSYV
jgi:hypothetical protein